MHAFRHLQTRICTASLILVVLLLQACATTEKWEPAVITSPLEKRAAVRQASGDHEVAARIYLQAANEASGQKKHQLQLKAADNLLLAEDYAGAGKLLQSLPLTSLNLLNMQHYDINRARIAMHEKNPDVTLSILKVVPMSGPFVADIHRLRAQAYQQKDMHFETARERVLLDPLIGDSEKRLQNHYTIWKSLNQLSDPELNKSRTAAPPDPMSGWIELLELSRLYMQQSDMMKEVLPHWRQRYPAHPANLGFLDNILGTIEVSRELSGQMALLLPLSGKFAAAATAIRDGLMAAYYDTPESSEQPQLRVYDTGGSAAGALDAYRQAVTEGAGFIIGPLHKESVQALADQQMLEVPVLALNNVPGPLPGNRSFYQFGLAPEDEAREAARAAWRDGHRRSVALIPSSEWGERVYAAFAEAWERLGGNLLEVQRYDTSNTDHGDVISDVLNLNASKRRHAAMSRLLGTKLEFEERRRQDVDFVFLLASPRQARLIRPQLSFYRASNLPVYATSQVYTGTIDAKKDIDMNGITFCDMPWVLERNGEWAHLQRAIWEQWPENADRYQRLYALGIDAYRIIPFISRLGGGLFGTFPGVSGNLSLDGQGQVNRELRCAKFINGQPQLMAPLVRQQRLPAEPPGPEAVPTAMLPR